MRKLALAATTAIGVLVVAVGVAFATNTYTSTSKITPSKSGTSSKPTPVSASLTFNVGETQPNTRPLPLKTYSIGLGAGIVANNKLFGGCSLNQANSQNLPLACKKSIVGGGSVNALVGNPNDRTASTSLKCFLKVTLLNSVTSGHIYIRIDGGPTSTPSCPTEQHSAIDAKFVKTGRVAKKGGGKLNVYAIKFTVPDAILNPAGLATTVISDVSNVKKLKVTKKIKGKKVTHGYLESVGCPKNPSGLRTATVVFTDTSGQTFSAESNSPCKT